MSEPADGLAIDPARRLPAELLDLLQRHPRAGWRDGAGLGELGRFWLERHRMFRALTAELSQGIQHLREARHAPADVAGWLGPRLRLYLGELDGHHRIEDAHYFPAFRAAEPRLVAGFELLERDHHALEAHRDAVVRLGRSLDRHLDDEEDLVMPLLMAHGAG